MHRRATSLLGTPNEVLAQRLVRPVAAPPGLPTELQLLLCSMLDRRPERRPCAAEVARQCTTMLTGAMSASLPETAALDGGMPYGPGVPCDTEIAGPTMRIVTARVDRRARGRRESRRWLRTMISAGAVLAATGLLLGSAGLVARDGGAPARRVHAPSAHLPTSSAPPAVTSTSASDSGPWTATRRSDRGLASDRRPVWAPPGQHGDSAGGGRAGNGNSSGNGNGAGSGQGDGNGNGNGD